MREENIIGRMISDMEQELEACKKADLIIYNWKCVYSMANEDLKRRLIKEMLNAMGFSAEEINKMYKF